MLGTFLIVLAQPMPAAAKDDLPYPWCAVKGDPECTFMTLHQCEESASGAEYAKQIPIFPIAMPGGAAAPLAESDRAGRLDHVVEIS